MILNLKRKISRRSLIFYFICLYSLNAVLLFLVIGQGILAGFLVAQKEIPVPQFVLKNLEKNLADYGLYARAEHLSFDLRGRIFAHRLKFFKGGTGDLLGQVESFQMTLDIPLLLLKKVSVDSMKFQNGSLFCPAFYSNSGVSEKLAEKIHGQFKRAYNDWEIERFDLKIHNLQTHTSGIWPRAGFSLPVEPTVQPAFRPSSLERYLALCRDALEMKAKFQSLEQPIAKIRLTFAKGEPPEARVKLSGNSFQGPEKLKSGVFQVEFPRIRLPSLNMVEPIGVQAGFVDWENRLRARDLEARLATGSLNDLLAAQVKNLQFSAASLQIEGINLEGIGGEALADTFPRVSGSVKALAQNQLLRVTGDFDLKNLSGRLDVDSRAEITEKIKAALTSQLDTAAVAVLEQLVLSSAPRLRASCWFGRGFVFEKADFEVATGPFSFGGVDFLRITVRGEATPRLISFDEIGLEKPDERVAGSLDVNLIQGDYRLLLTGKGFPIPLNPIMPDWWDNIWKKMEFSGHPIVADLEARANWKTGRLGFYFGGYSGKEITFQSAKFDTFDLKSWSQPGFIEIYDLNATRPEGEAVGTVAWVFLGKHAISQVLDLEANIDIEPLSGLLGPGVAKVVEDFEVSEPPDLHLVGNLYYPNAPWPNLRDIHLQARAQTALSYQDYPLDYLNFEGRLTDDRFDMERVGFGFAGGNGTGQLSWQDKEPLDQLNLDLHLKEADPKLAFETLGWLPIEEVLTEASTDNPTEEPKSISSGLLDVELNATGVPGDFLSFKGLGNLTVTKAELGRVHLFGGLSRALYGTWVDFTTLKLDSAEGQFFLNEDIIQFSEVSVSGPGSLIRANGEIIMPDRGLDFKVRVHFFEKGGASLLSILGPILKPFENALELRLRGTIDEPKWRFQIDPRNVFSSPVTQRSISEEEKGKDLRLPPIPATGVEPE